jgi:predicted ester cyclase
MSVQRRLAMPFDPAEQRAIKRLWVRHSIAEERRDIDGLIATLAPECRYELIGTGLRWEGHAGARAFYTELFAAFPDNTFALTDIVIGPQGLFEAVVLDATHAGPFAGLAPTGRHVRLELAILFPWNPSAKRFDGEQIFIDRAALAT